MIRYGDSCKILRSSSKVDAEAALESHSRLECGRGIIFMHALPGPRFVLW